MPVVPRVPPFDRCATGEDLARLPADLVAEIVDGELHANPGPAAPVASSAMALGGTLRRAFEQRGQESWQILPGPELHLGADILVPGLAGWRLSRLPELPATAYFSVPPEWVCEILSSSPASLRARKLAIYAREGVSHVWLIDPVARTLDVRRLEDGRWAVLATCIGDQAVRAEPFEALDLQLAALWPRE
ncbi:MAG: Uma2 family endonuclease [Vicinamibacterales bacterium]